MYCQPMDLEELKKKSRIEIIEMAVKQLNDPAFKKESYDRIQVMAGDHKLYVIFDVSICYIPKGKSWYGSIYVDIPGRQISKSVFSNEAPSSEPGYYSLDEKNKEAIDFIMKSINKSNTVGDLPGSVVPEGSRMLILEKPDCYAIEMDSETIVSNYKIRKKTGEIYEAGHNHMILPDDDSVKSTIYEIK
jgi:hypothetical protein